MSIVGFKPFAWTIENGIIRFTEPVTGTFEVVTREDIDPNMAPAYSDSLFNGNKELIRLYTPMVRAYVRMKLAERLWKEAPEHKQVKAEKVLALATAQYEMAKSRASSMRTAREAGLPRFQPIIGRSRVQRDWSEW